MALEPWVSVSEEGLTEKLGGDKNRLTPGYAESNDSDQQT